MAIEKTVLIDSISINALADAITLRLLSAANGLIMAEHASGPMAEILKHKHDEALEHFGKVEREKERAERLRNIEELRVQKPEPLPPNRRYMLMRESHEWNCANPDCRAVNKFPEVSEGTDFNNLRMTCWSCRKGHTFNIETRRVRLSEENYE